jgi:hypothetical protein
VRVNYAQACAASSSPLEAKSCSEFTAEAVPLLILEPPAAAIATMAAKNKCLARNNKPQDAGKATKKR